MTHVSCRLTAKNRDQLRNPTLGSRVWATFTFLFHIVSFLSHLWVFCCREITYYTVKKGVNFTTNLEKQETDLTADMINRSQNVLHSAFIIGNCELCLLSFCRCIVFPVICHIVADAFPSGVCRWRKLKRLGCFLLPGVLWRVIGWQEGHPVSPIKTSATCPRGLSFRMSSR